MSSIIIRCIKHNEEKMEECHEKEQFHKDYEKEETKDKGNELIIESTQLFMNTEKFFNSVKETLTQYFDKIEKK